MIGTAARRRAALSFLDQVVSSGSNFASGVIVARLSGAGQYGEYMLAFTVWVVVVGLHRALIAEPLIIRSGATDAARSPVGQGLVAEVLLGAALGVVVAIAGVATIAAGAPFGLPLLTLAPWLVCLLVQDYWRAICFQRQRPGLALSNDVVFLAVQLGMIIVFASLGWRTAGYIIAAWGIGATAGSVLGLWWFRSFARPSEGRRLLRHLWPLSRWTLADFSTGFAADQAYLAFVALLLAPVDYGGFRAAASFMGPIIVILHAGSNIGLPEASRRAASQGVAALGTVARRLTGGAFACIALYGTAVGATGEKILRLVYGDSFAEFAPLVALASVQYMLAVLVFGQGIALKAAGRMRLLWRARALVAVASLISMVVLVSLFGTIGAGWAGVCTGGYFAIGVYAVYRAEFLRRPERTDQTVPVTASPAFSFPLSPDRSAMP